jgi:hypothetical protein
MLFNLCRESREQLLVQHRWKAPEPNGPRITSLNFEFGLVCETGFEICVVVRRDGYSDPGWYGHFNVK